MITPGTGLAVSTPARPPPDRPAPSHSVFNRPRYHTTRIGPDSPARPAELTTPGGTTQYKRSAAVAQLFHIHAHVNLRYYALLRLTRAIKENDMCARIEEPRPVCFFLTRWFGVVT